MSFLPIPDPIDSIIKITAFCYRKPGLSWDEFIKHWRNTHVEKFIRNPKAASKLLGYVQVRFAMKISPRVSKTAVSMIAMHLTRAGDLPHP